MNREACGGEEKRGEGKVGEEMGCMWRGEEGSGGEERRRGEGRRGNERRGTAYTGERRKDPVFVHGGGRGRSRREKKKKKERDREIERKEQR